MERDHRWRSSLRSALLEMDRSVDTIVVEGPRDESGLRAAGVEGRVVQCASGPSLDALVRTLPGDRVTILTDFDSHGKRLNGRLRHRLSDARVISRHRRRVGLVLTQGGHYEIEALNGIFDPSTTELRLWKEVLTWGTEDVDQ